MEQRRSGGGSVEHEGSACYVLIHDGIIHHVKVRPGITGVRPFLEVSHNRSVLRVRSLLDQIADHIGSPAVRDITLIAVGPVLARQAIVEDVIHRGSRLQQMPHAGIM